MHVIVLAPMAEVGQSWQYSLEDLGADWRCMPVTTAEAAYPMLADADVLLLLPGLERDALLAQLDRRPPLAPPYILGGPDGLLPPAEELPGLLAAWRRDGRLPVMHIRHLAQTQEMASALLRAMDVPPRLRAWAFLPDMLALTVVHPPLLRNLRHHLYPMIAARHGMTAAGVERSLRLCIESTWTHGSLVALERFFGMSVDPEKGKPTNAAFLRRVSALVKEGMQRLLQR
ncbi:MAG: hypothetical protein E7318_06435 [Clostridiales bacterium]|nr:hypothetical protein [Clostridiales bacterium]